MSYRKKYQNAEYNKFNAFIHNTKSNKYSRFEIDLSHQDFYSSTKTVLNMYCFWALKTLNVLTVLNFSFLRETICFTQHVVSL